MLFLQHRTRYTRLRKKNNNVSQKDKVIKVSGIGAVVKVVDSHPCGWGSIPSNSCSFLIVSLSKSLSLCFMCSDQYVKHWMPCGFPSTSSLLLYYHIKQYTYITEIRSHCKYTTTLVKYMNLQSNKTRFQNKDYSLLVCKGI